MQQRKTNILHAVGCKCAAVSHYLYKSSLKWTDRDDYVNCLHCMTVLKAQAQGKKRNYWHRRRHSEWDGRAKKPTFVDATGGTHYRAI